MQSKGGSRRGVKEHSQGLWRTGQIINLQKSVIPFRANVSNEVKTSIQKLFRIFREDGIGTYLGLLEYISGSKIDLLVYIKEKLKSRLSGWFARSLSLGGKEVLLKAAALAMLVYAMTCFKLPKATCTSLSSAMTDF